jgi:CDP-diglyceride synthetase
MAPTLIVTATLLIVVVFIFLVQGPEAGFASGFLLALAALIGSPLASRPRSRWSRNLRRFTFVVWGLMFYCMYRAAAEEDIGWAWLAMLCIVVAAVTTIAYWQVQSQKTDSQ